MLSLGGMPEIGPFDRRLQPAKYFGRQAEFRRERPEHTVAVRRNAGDLRSRAGLCMKITAAAIPMVTLDEPPDN
jgi:hypothetical protein